VRPATQSEILPGKTLVQSDRTLGLLCRLPAPVHRSGPSGVAPDGDPAATRVYNPRRRKAAAVFQLPILFFTKYTIGWIGSPSTARYLRDIAPALAEVCRDGHARVRLVGSGAIDLPGVPVEVVAWREDSEVEEIRGFDVGVMPLPDEPWARGKCGFTLIQYMACWLPVVASPVGVNAEIVEEGGNGFLAADREAWVKALEALRVDAALGRRLGAAGRGKVEARYCQAVTGPRVAVLLRAV